MKQSMLEWVSSFSYINQQLNLELFQAMNFSLQKQFESTERRAEKNYIANAENLSSIQPPLIFPSMFIAFTNNLKNPEDK